MNTDNKNNKGNNNANDQRKAEVVPGTENISRNPNPMANENIRVRSEPPASDKNDRGVGSEITDGEDG
ncbi:MAG TPA: hypothetical protein VNS32_11970 [Flavisolibacter sp.]|nr:hypothetical protein [Flavisolibacter sp.]